MSELSRTMTIAQFENGYWYVEELKSFAHELGVPMAKKLRKDELELAIKAFITEGKLIKPPARNLNKLGPKDIDSGLRVEQKIINYTSNRETKDFLEKEARKLKPEFKVKSGTRYLLNRWREEQISQGKPITYGDLIEEMIRLSAETKGPLRTTHGRYNNFISDFMATKSGTREQAIEAWGEAKQMKGPKTFLFWQQSKGRKVD